MLDEAQGRLHTQQQEERFRPYTASLRFDVQSLSKIGMTPQEISYSLSVPLALVRSHKARIEKEKAARRKFLMTAQLPWLETVPIGVFSILQK